MLPHQSSQKKKSKNLKYNVLRELCRGCHHNIGGTPSLPRVGETHFGDEILNPYVKTNIIFYVLNRSVGFFNLRKRTEMSN